MDQELSALREHARRVHQILQETYGEPHWRPRLAPLDELVFTILSQNTADVNTERTYASLKARYPAWTDVMSADPAELADTIRLGGLANIKAPRIQNVLQTIYEKRGDLSLEFLNEMELEAARQWLTRLSGVGPKTAACVLLFSFGRPTMPVDTHVYRLSKRIGFLPDKISQAQAHETLEKLVPPEAIYPFHINLIKHGRAVCHARRPACAECSVQADCHYAPRELTPSP